MSFPLRGEHSPAASFRAAACGAPLWHGLETMPWLRALWLTRSDWSYQDFQARYRSAPRSVSTVICDFSPVDRPSAGLSVREARSSIYSIAIDGRMAHTGANSGENSKVAGVTGEDAEHQPHDQHPQGRAHVLPQPVASPRNDSRLKAKRLPPAPRPLPLRFLPQVESLDVVLVAATQPSLRSLILISVSSVRFIRG